MKTGHIFRKSINTTNWRFDAGYHLSDGVGVKRIIDGSPCKLLKISDATERIFIGGRNKRVYVSSREHGIPFLSSSDILQADLENVKLASKKYTPDIEGTKLQKGWTLISRSGTVGNCAFATAKHAQKLASEDVIRLVPNNILRKGYLYAYLASKHGYSLLTQGTFGAVIQHIEPDFIGSLPIPQMPEAFQQEVDDLIQESARLREEATDALNEAKKTLSDYIGINFALTQGCKIGLIQNKSLTSSIQTSFCSHSFLNNSVAAFERIKDKCQLLGSCKVDVWYPGMFKRAYVNNGLPYMQGSSIFETNPFRRCAHLSKARTPKLDELWLKENYILITCAGSLGQVKIITKEYEDKMAIGSPDIIRVFSKDSLFTNEFLFAYLQLPLVQDYMQSFKYGSVIERFDALRVKSIPIIIPTKEISDSVTDLIRYYKDCTYKSFCKEEKAISMVEQEIEKWNK